MLIKCTHCRSLNTETNPFDSTKWYCKNCGAQGMVASAQYGCVSCDTFVHEVFFGEEFDHYKLKRYRCMKCERIYVAK